MQQRLNRPPNLRLTLSSRFLREFFDETQTGVATQLLLSVNVASGVQRYC